MMRTIALLLSLLGHTHAHAAPSLHRPFVAKPATTALSTNHGPQLRLPPLSTTLAYTGLATTLAGASIATNAALGASAAAIVAGSMAVPAVSLIGQVYFIGGGARIAKMMGGVPADARLHAMAIDAANRVGVPAPATVWELPNDAPNAFAVGLRKADTAVAVTRGLRASLTTTELQAVLAHEMGHLHAGDSSKSIHIATAVAGMAGMYNAGRALLRADRSSSSSSKKKDKDKDEGSAAGLGVALMAAGMAANVGGHLMRLSVSRGAEFKADAAAAAAYGAPAMISALEKIEVGAQRKRSGDAPALQHAFLAADAFSHSYISNPAPSLFAAAGGRTGKGAPWWRKVLGVLSTHPSTEDRIERLRASRA